MNASSITSSATAHLALPPLSLYIHIPWCIKKCPYCDFNSHVNPAQTLPEQQYLSRLKEDLAQEMPLVQGRKLQSIFFGGGTPSLFSGKTINAILEDANNKIGFEDNIEITLEANPGTFEQNKFIDYLNAGINRLSLGIQSFEETHLKKLGRIHNKQEALDAITKAKDLGYNNINIDLMHGLPEQSVDEAISDLSTAIAFEPNHISWYQLTIEPNTVFYRQPPPLPADDTLANIQDAGTALLAKHHYHQYEVSAFSQGGQQSQHNMNYWSFGDYIGIGAGAHGKQTDISSQQVIRRQKTRLPEHYINDKTQPLFKESIVSKKEIPLEFLMNALRLNEGVPSDLFPSRTGMPIEVVQEALSKLTQQGLIEDNKNRIKTSELGLRFLNTVLTQLMSDD